MAGTYFKLNDSVFVNALNKAAGRIGRTKELMETIGETLVSGAKERFDDGVAPDGAAWIKGRKTSGKTLTDRGTLKKSVTCNAGISEVVYGSNLQYAAIHQFGGVIKAKNKKSLSFQGADGKTVFVKKVTIPARPFIGVSEEDEAEIKEMVTLHIRDAFR